MIHPQLPQMPQSLYTYLTVFTKETAVFQYDMPPNRKGDLGVDHDLRY